MDEAFIIMQIGNAAMDRVCDDVLVPAIEAAGLIARRVDSLGRVGQGLVDLIQLPPAGFLFAEEIEL